MTIETFLPAFAKILVATNSHDRLERTAAEVGRFFAVEPHEVAYFQFDSNQRTATFRWPPQASGTSPLPLKAFASSLVSTTARTEQGFVNNAFVTTPHLHMFERLLAEPQQRVPIQKIMSAVVRNDTAQRGVIQVCRKGRSLAEAGADFSSEDLLNLQQIADILSRFEL